MRDCIVSGVQLYVWWNDGIEMMKWRHATKKEREKRSQERKKN